MKARYFILGIIIILLTYNCCTTKNSIPDNELINEIILETIKQDSLDNSLTLSNKLINYYLYNVSLEKNTNNEFAPPPPPPPPSEKGKPFTLYYFRLNQEKLIGYTITPEDSIFFVKQISNGKNIELDTIQLSKIIKIKNHSKEKKREFYEFLIPLFNHNKTIAWVEYNHRCPACGQGRMIVFKKVNNEWRIILSYETWTN